MNLFLQSAFLLLTVIVSTQTQTEDIPQNVVKALKKYVKTGKVEESIQKNLKQIHQIEDKFLRNPLVCNICENVVNYVIETRRSGKNRQSMYNLIYFVCVNLVNWKPEDCSGYLNIELDTALYIIDNKPNLTGAHVCSIKLQTYGCKDPNAKKWTVNIPPKNTQNYQQATQSTCEKEPLKLLHVTDIHYDPTYKPGTSSVCNHPLCCEETSGEPNSTVNTAGFWGDYHVCDMPWHAVEDVFTQIQNKHSDVSMIYFTGDIISHKNWGTSKADNIVTIKKTYDKFKETFRGKIVYPVLGNHEPHPCDFYSPENVTESLSSKWVFELITSEWSAWLPETTKTTLLKGGYYTVLAKPGFRIIGLNSNVCYNGNIWLMYEEEDPYDQLKWLVEVLLEAEKNSELVHILSHVPPGEQYCLQTWSREYHKIIDRFANTISAQFNGHTHLDELRVFYSMEKSDEVINVAFNGGSFTTFVGFNPNYRIYDIDDQNFKVQNFDEWIYNLTEANQTPLKPPRWYKLYSFKEAYGLDALEYDDFGMLVKRMKENKTLVEQYFRFKVRESDPEMANGCDDACLLENLCSITAVESEDSINCLNSIF